MEVVVVHGDGHAAGTPPAHLTCSPAPPTWGRKRFRRGPGRRSMKLLATCSLLMITLAFAGCTDGGNGDDGFETPEQDAEGRYIIHMENNKFVPAQAKVPVGSTVVWIMEEGSHNVVPDGHSEWEASTVSSSKGEHHEATLDTAGTFDYHCQPHQSLGMKGSIKVA